MMESNEQIKAVHKVNESMKVLMQDLSVVIDNMSVLTKLVYNTEIEKLDKEIEQKSIKLRSHM